MRASERPPPPFLRDGRATMYWRVLPCFELRCASHLQVFHSRYLISALQMNYCAYDWYQTVSS